MFLGYGMIYLTMFPAVFGRVFCGQSSCMANGMGILDHFFGRRIV